MQIDVIVLRRRTIQAVAVWLFATDENGKFSALVEAGKRLPAKDAWRQLALKINQLACDNSHLMVDVFLLLRGQLSENLHNAGQLKEVVEAARDYTWGSNIYIAWDRKRGFDELYKGNELVLKEWFSLLLEYGVTALIEIPPPVRAKEPDILKILHLSALKAEDQRTRLQKLVRHDGWGLIVHDTAYYLEEFIRLFFTDELQFPGGQNRAIFYDRKPRYGWMRLLKQLPANYHGALFVSTPPLSGVKDLVELLEQLWPGLKPFYFNGIFEWLYAFIRLIKSGDTLDPEPPLEQSHPETIWVTPAEKTLFESAPPDGDLCLLVTSGFHFSMEQTSNSVRASDLLRADEAEQCIEAAKEIGGILRRLPFHVDVEVHHCIICESLPEHLTTRTFTAWIHLSHGNRTKGFYEGLIGQDASPQRWLDSFQVYKRSLQLVIFSACESAEVARLFAEAGVSVAIGFDNKVLTKAARKLSAIVMPVALQTGDRQDAILHTFRKAIDVLRSHTYVDEDEDRDENYGSAKPKAFVFKKVPS